MSEVPSTIAPTTQVVPAAATGRPPSRYTITGTFGEGGMSVVYSAFDEHLRREVAVKVFTKPISGTDSEEQQLEIDVLAGLNHHAVVTLIDAGIAPDPDGVEHRYLVLEPVDGADLRRRLASARLSLRHIAEIGYDLAEALEYVHRHGVIHRDLKPGNVLVVTDGDDGGRARAKLTDFGIALSSGIAHVTRPEGTTGTAAYLSPEQARGDVLTGASDVYSLGLVLLECHTGRLAFPGAPVDSAMARLSTDPEIPAELPEQWRLLLTAMTAREPKDRPADHEVVQALRDLVVAEGSRHRASSGLTAPELSTARAFETIAAIAARTFDVPVAVLSLVHDGKVQFAAHHGVPDDRMPALESICSGASSSGPLIVEDAATDPRVMTHELVTGEFGLRFYAGIPVRSAKGAVVGTLCVVDSRPRTVAANELATLHDLAGLATVIRGTEAAIESASA